MSIVLDGDGPATEAPAPVVVSGRRRSPAAVLFDDPATVAEIRRRVEETAESMASIADGYGVPHASLRHYIRKHRWSRPEGAPKAVGGVAKGGRRLAAGIEDAGEVQARLVRAVDRQVRKIETRLRKPGAEVTERDARILGTLAKTLETLIALERDGAATAKPEPVNRAERDAELARRIARWAEGQSAA